MKYVKRILPYILAAAIIFAGYVIIDGIKVLLPSHKETIKVFEKPENDNLFYMGNNDGKISYH